MGKRRVPNLFSCFACSKWISMKYKRVGMFEGTEQEICALCHHKLTVVADDEMEIELERAKAEAEALSGKRST